MNVVYVYQPDASESITLTVAPLGTQAVIVRPETERTWNVNEMLTVKHVAAALKISVRQAWKLLASGRLPRAIRVGGTRSCRWRASDIARYIELDCDMRQFEAAAFKRVPLASMRESWSVDHRQDTLRVFLWRQLGNLETIARGLIGSAESVKGSAAGGEFLSVTDLAKKNNIPLNNIPALRKKIQRMRIGHILGDDDWIEREMRSMNQDKYHYRERAVLDSIRSAK
ncbi:MAG: helix-turn-helix domain-containing protein [Planctomycetes bacterium]|nr:helix-turn-helix domain-containing protein [Planctomycetota bacterium]MBI3835813.1 helix-turn-helix domain-containing protein [Planctomycetota bacterium]